MRTLLIFLFCLNVSHGYSQELFPHVEPASNIPAGVLGVRVINEFYDEVDVLRSMQSFRLMWGFNPKLMFSQSYTFGNHHGNKLPEDFIANDGRIGIHTHGIDKGIEYPYRFENLNNSLKYRFLSLDGKNEHFRVAANFDFAIGSRAHDEAEPSFQGDNSGLGAGITATLLKNKFAVSLNGNVIMPHKYSQSGIQTIEIQYGNALNYNLSMGYLLLPRKYKSFKQTNINLYVEFIGKIYEAAEIEVDNQSVLIADVPGLEKGKYIEIRPSIQFIIHSNTRIDFSIAKPVMNMSYVRTYPAYYFNLQHYFFF